MGSCFLVPQLPIYIGQKNKGQLKKNKESETPSFCPLSGPNSTLKRNIHTATPSDPRPLFVAHRPY
jgi:hypothetical protein